MNLPASKKVVVTDFTFPDVTREGAAAARNGATFESHACKTAREAADAVDGADVAVVQFVNFDAAAIARLRPGATILRYGIGFDNIDVAAAAARGIRVGYVPDYCVDEVADHTATAILTLRQKLFAQDRAVRDGRWAAVEVARPLQNGPDTTIGFLGLGRIGGAVLARLRPFGFRFAVADPALDDAHAAELGVARVEVDRLFEIADVLTLHAPATPSTVAKAGGQAHKARHVGAHQILAPFARRPRVHCHDGSDDGAERAGHRFNASGISGHRVQTECRAVQQCPGNHRHLPDRRRSRIAFLRPAIGPFRAQACLVKRDLRLCRLFDRREHGRQF